MTGIVEVIQWALEGVVWLLKTIVFWVFDILFLIIVAVLEPVIAGLGIDFSFFADIIDALPVQLVDMALRCGAAEASGIIITALAARFVLGLIPFVRIGGGGG